MQSDPLEQARQAGTQVHHFHGGLRLRHNKKISCESPIRQAPLPARLNVPLLQHAGEAAAACVRAGQHVLKGEVIGRFEDPERGFVHAPTSGTVSAIARLPISHPSGRDGPCVVIRPDGLDEWRPLAPLRDWQNCQPEHLRDVVREAGIVGLGGAVFPSGRKVDDAHQRSVHTLILNGAECEPFISCDEMLMREQPQRIIEGAAILMRASGAKRAVIAIEDQMGVVNEVLRRAVKSSDYDSIDVVKVTTIYPEGGERQLIQVLTGLEVPSGGRPTDLGLLCINVATAAAVADAVCEDRPLIERVVTVTGRGVRRPQNLLCRLGTPISDLVEWCGGYEADAARLILGGPMMGYALASDANPVIKAANCILVLRGEDLEPPQDQMPCIRCGECSRVCPAVLLPQELHFRLRTGRVEAAGDIGLRDCIECGCCDFVCPSQIPLTSWFRFGKTELRHLLEEQGRSELARRRFEDREERLKRNEEERRQRIRDKKKALRDRASKKQQIAEAVDRAAQKKSESADGDGGRS